MSQFTAMGTCRIPVEKVMRRTAQVVSRALPATLAAGAAAWSCSKSRLEVAASTEDDELYLVKDALTSGAFCKLRVEHVKNDGRGSRIITLGLPSQFHRIGARAQHTIRVRSEDGSNESEYAPISRDSELGQVQVVAAGESGAAGPLSSIAAGEFVEAAGPSFHDGVVSGDKPAVGIITDADGAATTFQAVQRLLDNPRDSTEIRVLYETPSEDDIALRNRLEALALIHPRFKVRYAATEAASEKFDGFAGPVDAGMVARTMPPPAAGTEVVVAGSEGLRNRLCGADGVLAGMKYEAGAVKCVRQ